MADIKRQTELYLVDKLTNAIPGHTFVPFTGGSESSPAVEIEPPFTVVSVADATKVMATEGTWLVTGVVQVITHHAETTSTEHSVLARSIYAVLSDLPPGTASLFSFSGIDISDMTTADDDASQAHADIIHFTCGVGG